MLPDAINQDVNTSGNPPPAGDVISESPNLDELVCKWWQLTNDLPDRDEGVIAANECRKALFPSWFDKKDPFKGNKHRDVKTRSDIRLVRNNRMYKVIQQSVAMVVPDDHSFRFETDVLVGESELNPRIKETHKTLEALSKYFLDESRFTEYAQENVFNAHIERLAVLKMNYQREYVGEPVHVTPERRDIQDNIERLRVLTEQFAAGNFDRKSKEFAELVLLKNAILSDSELKLWNGFVFDLIPYAAFGIDPTVRAYQSFYSAKWMFHEVWKSEEELLQMYPKRINEDGYEVGIDKGSISTLSSKKSGETSNGQAEVNRSDKGPNPNQEAKVEANRYKVREIWARCDNRVYVICENYPKLLSCYVPKRVSANWYPFYPLRLNPRPHACDGIADAELMKDIQDRINWKRTDEENARHLALPRGIYNALETDEKEMQKLSRTPPGSMTGLKMQTGPDGSIDKVLKFTSFPFVRDSFDTTNEEIELQLMASMPAALGGAVGSANYSAEVDAAMQGAAINANQRGTIVRKWLESIYVAAAQIIMQEVSNEEVVEICGPNAFLPAVYSESEANRIKEEIKASAQELVRNEIQAAALEHEAMMVDGATTSEFVPPDKLAIQARINQLVSEQSMAIFGWPEPVSGESILRRMHCKVTVALNTQADRTSRLAGIEKVGATIQMLAQAAQSCGKIFDPNPLLQQVVPLFGGDQAIMEMFKDPPPQMMLPPPANNSSMPASVEGRLAHQPNETTQIDTPKADNKDVQIDSPTPNAGSTGP
jgi:hypothetical protein